MTPQQVEALAVYFTGHAVVYHSISLGLPESPRNRVATEFFAARLALGIFGYVSKEEAVKTLASRLEQA